MRFSPGGAVLLVSDIGHANLLPGGVDPWIDASPNKIYHLHLNDNDGKLDQHLPIGDGSIDFRGVLRRLGDIGLDGTGTLEVSGNEKRVKSLKRIREILKSL